MIQELNISDNLCTICIQEFNGNEIECLSCYNKFHIECINRWCKEGPNKLCPLCKNNQICLTLLKKKRHILRVKQAQRQGERYILERRRPRHRDIMILYTELREIEREIDELDSQIDSLELENRREQNTFLPISGGMNKAPHTTEPTPERSPDNFSDTQSDFYSDPLDNSSHSIRRATEDIRNKDLPIALDLMEKLKLKEERKKRKKALRLNKKLIKELTYLENELPDIRIRARDAKLNPPIIEDLLKKGADPNFFSEDDITALSIASKNNWLEITKLLLKYGAKIDIELPDRNTPLVEAVKRGHYNMVLLLIENGANVNFSHNRSNMTVLQWAIIKSDEDIVKLLLKNGANPYVKAETGQTAFEFAQFWHENNPFATDSMRDKQMNVLKVFEDYYAQKAVDKGMVAEVGAMYKLKLPANISGEYGKNIEGTDFKDGEIQKFLGGMKPEDLTPEKLEELLSTYRVNNKIYEYLDIFDKKHPRFDCKSDESKLDELEKWMIHTLLTLQLTFEDASFYIGGRVIPNTPLRRDIYFSDEENVNETKLKTEEEIKNFIRDFKKQPSIEIKKLLKMFVSTTPRVHNHTGTVRHFFMDLVVVYNYYLFERIDWNSNVIRPYNRENSNDYRFGIGGLWSLRNGALNQRVEEEINAHKELKLNVSAFKKKLIRISCYRAEEKSRKRRLKKQEDIRMDDDSDDSAESLNSLFDKKLKLSGV